MLRGLEQEIKVRYAHSRSNDLGIDILPCSITARQTRGRVEGVPEDVGRLH